MDGGISELARNFNRITSRLQTTIEGLQGEVIPLAARILAVADSFDAMISDRAYKPTRTRQDAIEELRRCRGAQFDPDYVDAFLVYLEERPEAGVLCPA